MRNQTRQQTKRVNALTESSGKAGLEVLLLQLIFAGKVVPPANAQRHKKEEEEEEKGNVCRLTETEREEKRRRRGEGRVQEKLKYCEDCSSPRHTKITENEEGSSPQSFHR